MGKGAAALSEKVFYKPLYVDRCGLCSSNNLTRLLDLGQQPLAEDMRADAPKYPLALVRCDDCDLVQLDYIVDQREVFKPDHTYSSGNSRQLHTHFQSLADELSEGLVPGNLVVDIGCNDGTLLSKLPNWVETIGIDPTKQVWKTAESSSGLTKVGYNVRYQSFFSEDVAKELAEKYPRAKVILATNVLAHVPDPHDFLEGVRTLLAEDGVFVTENHDVDVVLNGQWDTVYHEHLRYYSPETLRRLLEMHGLEVDNTQRIDTHGGSWRTYARKARTLQQNADQAAAALRNMLYDITARQDENVVGIGATTRASGLIHFAGLVPFIRAVCEVSTSDKIGKVMPGTQIPIVDEAILFGESQPKYALLFSWHLESLIVPLLRDKGFRGQIITPLPEPHVLDA